MALSSTSSKTAAQKFQPDTTVGRLVRGPDRTIGGHSAVWMPPAKYRNTEACDQGDDLDADLYPVLDWRGVSMRNPSRPVQKTVIEVPDLSLGKAIPNFAAGTIKGPHLAACLAKLAAEPYLILDCGQSRRRRWDIFCFS